MSKGESYLEARKKFSEANAMLIGSATDDKEQFNRAWNAGTQTIRTYHDEEHFHDIAGRGKIETAMDAVRFRSGINHDVVYHQVDAKGDNKSGFSAEVEPVLEKYITRDGNNLVLRKDPQLADDKLFQAAMTLFNFDETKRATDGITLSPFAGQNEFLSALYAMEQAKEIGIPDKYILAELAHIQGTVPFGPAEHFDALEKRLEKANATLAPGQQLSSDEIVQTIDSSVRMANTDVVSFAKDFDKFIVNSRELMIENVAVSPDHLDKPAFMLAATMGPVGFLEGMLANNSPSGKNRIYHSAHGQPEASAMAADEAKGIVNIKQMGEYFRANAAAAAVVTAISVANTPAGQAPTTDVSLNKLLNREFDLTPRGNGELTENGKVALAEAKDTDGKGILITDQVAAYLLESIGSDGISKLAKLANDTGINPAPAMPPFSPNPKPGMNTQELAGDFIKKAQEIFAEKGVDFNDVRQDLEKAMQSKELPFTSKEQFAERAQESKNKLDKFLKSDDWKKGGWAKGNTAS